jgi:hypothetical protein
MFAPSFPSKGSSSLPASARIGSYNPSVQGFTSETVVQWKENSCNSCVSGLRFRVALNPREIPVAENDFVMLNDCRLTSETVVQWNQKSLQFLCVGFRF